MSDPELDTTPEPDSTSPAHRPRFRRRTYLLALLAVTAVIVAAALSLRGVSPQPTDVATGPDEETAQSPPPTATASPVTPTAKASPAPSSDTAAPDPDGPVEDVASHLVETLHEQMGDYLDGDPVDLTSIATGTALSELEALAVEYEINEWRQEGTATIVDIDMIDEDLDADPPAITFEVCLDSSDMQLYDDADQPLLPTDAPQQTANIYVASQEDGHWRLTEHTFADDPDC